MGVWGFPTLVHLLVKLAFYSQRMSREGIYVKSACTWPCERPSCVIRYLSEHGSAESVTLARHAAAWPLGVDSEIGSSLVYLVGRGK